jgi:hypothetical protein
MMAASSTTRRWRPRRLACALYRDRRGVAALEFAMLFPILLILLLGTIEVGYVMMVDATLELAVRDASRYGMITPTEGTETRDQRIRDTVTGWVGRWMADPSVIDIDMLAYRAIDNIGEPEPFSDDNGNGVWDEGEEYTDVNGDHVWSADMGRASAGGREEIVLYTIDFSIPSLTGIPTLAGIDAFHFNRRIVVQNE